MSSSFWGDHIQDKETYGTPVRFFGVYRGTVENCSDPMGLGRVQVRVPAVNGILLKDKGDGDEIPTLSLPWASTVSYGGGYPDTGSQQTFHCGSQVAVQYESGSPYYPVVMGSYKYHPETPELTAYEDPRHEWPEYTVPIGGGNVKVKSMCNTPSEAAMLYRFTPTRGVVTKSIKGHTIWYEDKDQAECFEILDRVGQGIRFESPILFDDNKENKLARGIKSAFANYECEEAHSLRVMIRDGSLNEIKLERQEKEQRIQLKSKDTQLLLHGSRGHASLGDVVNNCVVEVDAHAKTCRITADRIILDGDVQVMGDISVHGDARLFRLVKSYVRLIVNQLNVAEK